MKTFTQIHDAISLLGILSGFVVMVGLIKAKRLDSWTAVFLASTLATSVTGFFFPFHGITPGIIVGIISVVLLVGAIIAKYFGGLLDRWRLLYVVTAMIAFYLNVFVLIAQLFQKVPSLRVLAPTQTEPPFLIAQVSTLVIFVALTITAAIKFRLPGMSRRFTG